MTDRRIAVHNQLGIGNMQQLEHRAVGADALQPRHIPWDEGDDDKDRAQIKIEIRQITELVARDMFIRGIRFGGGDGDDLAPINENMVISIALSTAPKPLGIKPP